MTANIYYDPEKFGLTVLGEIEAGGGWDFDTLVVWQDQPGQVYYATDSGCSCPVPFKNHSLATITRIVAGNWRDFEADVMQHGCAYRTDDPWAAQKTELLSRVSRLVPQQ